MVCVSINVTQKDPREVITKTKDYMKYVWKKVKQANRHPDWIGNMHQTGVAHSCESKKTLEEKGRKTVSLRKSMSDTRRSTLNMMFILSGTRLPPMIIFKGTPKGRIERRAEFPNLPVIAFNECQPKKAWCDERIMLLWVEKVVKPWVKSAPDHIVPLLILDLFKVHLLGSVMDEIQDCGIVVEHIPGDWRSNWSLPAR